MRVAIGLEYDGSAYVGWQRQKTGMGIQECLEKAISVVANESIKTFCAGRTDSGVHAIGQVVHFDTDSLRSERKWLLGINSNLPNDINVRWVSMVDRNFHARFSAISRTYRYVIFNNLARSSLNRDFSWWIYQDLDVEKMQEGANYLLGEHDFSALRSSGCQSKTPIRHILELKVWRKDSWIFISVTANAFLQHMVRNITGNLVSVGDGSNDPSWISALLDSGERTSGGIAAPSRGLTLFNVNYANPYTNIIGNGDSSDIYVYD